MKKILSLVLCFVFCLPFSFLVGCTNTSNKSHSFYETKIGYKLNVYPEIEFDYIVDDTCTVHVKDIQVELIKKNEIHENDTLTEPYHPYTFLVTAHGTTDSKHAGKTIYLHLFIEKKNNQLYYYPTTIANDGSICWEYEQETWNGITDVYFYDCSFRG